MPCGTRNFVGGSLNLEWIRIWQEFENKNRQIMWTKDPARAKIHKEPSYTSHKQNEYNDSTQIPLGHITICNTEIH